MSVTSCSCRILVKLEFSRQIFEKDSDLKFHQNPSSGSRVFPCERTDGRTDMTKLIVAFRNSTNAPKNHTNPMSNKRKLYNKEIKAKMNNLTEKNVLQQQQQLFARNISSYSPLLTEYRRRFYSISASYVGVPELKFRYSCFLSVAPVKFQSSSYGNSGQESVI